jgi:hypothetical protein
MVNSVLAHDAPDIRATIRFSNGTRLDRKLLIVKDDEAYCQPRSSPVWIRH